MGRHSDPDAVVIGAGVVGATTAYELAVRGVSVLVIDAGAGVGAGCSYANAGLLSPDHVESLANPHNVRDGLTMLARPNSPFLLRPRPGLIPWLGRFVFASRPRPSELATRVLRDLARQSLMIHAAYGQAGLSTSFMRRGSVDVFESPSLLRHYATTAATVLTPEQAHDRIPGLGPVAGAIERPADAQVESRVYVTDLLRGAEAHGARIQWRCQVTGVERDIGGIRALRTSIGPLRAGCYVLAAGVESATLGPKTGLRIPLQGAKGYVLDQSVAKHQIPMPVTFKERRVVATPYQDRLRLSGTLELGAPDLSLDDARLTAIWQAGSTGLAGVVTAGVIDAWAGFRPCTPDGLPMIGRSNLIQNLHIATGHGMWGVILAPITARWSAEDIAQESSPHPRDHVASRLLSPDRFGSRLARH